MTSFSKLNLKAKLGVISVAIFMSIALVEFLHIAYRLLVPDNYFEGIMHYNNYTHHDYMPNVSFVNRPKDGDDYPPALVSVNSLGIRGPELQEKGNYRVVMLGDSFIQADEVQFEKTFGERLNRAFDGEVEFVSHGISSWSPIIEYSWLYHKGLFLAPDEVNLFLCINDFWGDEKYGKLAVFYEDIPVCYKEKKQKKSFLKMLKSKLLIPSLLKREKKGNGSTFADVIHLYCEDDQNNWPRNRMKYYKRTLQIVAQINSFLEAKQIKLNVFLAPMGYAWKDEIEGVRVLPAYKGLGHKAISQESLEDYLLNDFKQLGVTFYKLEHVFTEAKQNDQGVKKLFNANDGHWNENGHEVLYRYFADFYRGL